ncbi:hypothetical protein [Mesorhizobium delmotii]|uniref:hypothetical protein n=1 Tax=Mesorhizobium delmotii TaxID=1631247 RepID=UPI003CC7D8E9
MAFVGHHRHHLALLALTGVDGVGLDTDLPLFQFLKDIQPVAGQADQLTALDQRLVAAGEGLAILALSFSRFAARTTSMRSAVRSPKPRSWRMASGSAGWRKYCVISAKQTTPLSSPITIGVAAPTCLPRKTQLPYQPPPVSQARAEKKKCCINAREELILLHFKSRIYNILRLEQSTDSGRSGLHVQKAPRD